MKWQKRTLNAKSATGNRAFVLPMLAEIALAAPAPTEIQISLLSRQKPGGNEVAFDWDLTLSGRVDGLCPLNEKKKRKAFDLIRLTYLLFFFFFFFFESFPYPRSLFNTFESCLPTSKENQEREKGEVNCKLR